MEPAVIILPSQNQNVFIDCMKIVEPYQLIDNLQLKPNLLVYNIVLMF